MSNHKFSYRWNLADGYPAPGITQHNSKVFTTFSCGGGSSMGYKLAGYDVFAANDIDPQMKKIYEANHHPRHYLLSDIRSLINKTDWPEEFKNLDVLDGSPPCSTFSVVGSREDTWGKEKIFREGQQRQVLDDLFFEFIGLAKILQPKVVISENVKGMLVGHAKGYVKQIFREFDEAGYTTQAFLLNGATMGVPQMRERVFFVSGRKDLVLPKLKLSFVEPPIVFGDIERGEVKRNFTDYMLDIWKQRKHGDKDMGDTLQRVRGKPSLYSYKYLYPSRVCNTIVANNQIIIFNEPRYMTETEVKQVSSFPLDYNFSGLNVDYVCGMSVPPLMMAQVSHQVYEQWLKSN
jgi:DNA (cytosine-5)-methyltransferase 1